MSNIRKIGSSKQVKLLLDMVINIFATALPIVILQFIILPLMATKLPVDDYGLALTLIGLITLITQPTSVALSNSRLLLDHEYNQKKYKGDFNVVLAFQTTIVVFISVVGTKLYSKNSLGWIDVFLILIITVIQLVRKYLLVSFRIKIEYRGVLNSNFILVIGYLIGFGIFFIFQKWQVIYLCGEGASFLYLLMRTNLLKEPLRTTPLLKKNILTFGSLLIASLLSTASSYIDRLLLFPIVGAKLLTIYYVSTLFGKTLSFFIGPINNVILSYLSRTKEVKKSSFSAMLLSSIVLAIFGYCFILLFSRPVLSLLYPAYFEEALNYVGITTATSMAYMICSVINPVLMTVLDIRWQVWINATNLVIYLPLALGLVKLYGLMGFCLGGFISMTVQLIFMISLYFFKVRK